MKQEDSQNLGKKLIQILLLFLIFSSSVLLLINSQFPVQALSEKSFIYTYNPKQQITTSLETHLKQQLISLTEYEAHVATELMLKDRIAKVKRFFESYGAKITGYEEIIVRKAHECGGDYRVLVGIAGNESGLGRIPYKLYNPYGYLNNTQYSSWEESLSILSCEISQRFLAPCNNDLYCIIRKYGGAETNQTKWIQNVTWFMSQV
ncbi:MAG: hypothetical protein Kow0081_3260 [Candidatus Dojkabacteria bacterium]